MSNNMRTTKSILAALLSAALLAGTSACTVKEARWGLPSTCIVDMTEFVEYGSSFDLNVWDSALTEPETHLTHVTRDEIAQPFLVDVPRKVIGWSFITASKTNTVRGHDLIYGDEPDRLYADCGTINAEQETSAITGEPFNQSARVMIHLSEDSGLDLSSLYAVIHSTSTGLDMRTLTPIPGSHDYTKLVDTNGVLDFYMYRQVDYSETIDIHSNLDENVRITIELGKFLESQDYLWTDRNLRDISLKVYITRTGVRIDVLPWEGNEDGDIIDV